jgi:hypothetical protein
MIKEQYREILSLTQLYLLQEYPEKAFLTASPSNYSYLAPPPPAKKPPSSPPPPPPATVSIPKRTAIPQAKAPSPQPQQVAPRIEPSIAKIAPKEPQKSEAPLKGEAPSRLMELFALDPMGPAEKEDLLAMRQLILERCPQIAIREDIPSDLEAQEVCRGWQQPCKALQIAILSFEESGQQREFLNNLARAIHLCFGSAAVVSAPQIEQENQWESFLTTSPLQLIIAASHSLQQLPRLTKHYKESPKQVKYALGKVPLYLLSDLSIYLQEPRLKAALWQAIRERIL